MRKNIKYFIPLFLILSELSFGQFYFFGRNKVQYDKFDWKVLRTDNFDIYYYNETEEIAEIGAFYAEEVYDELKEKLNHVVTRRVPLIFYNTHLHFQQTNTTPGFIPEGVGGFFEFIKGRVVIPSTGSLNQFRHVIRHELVHVFMTNKIYKVLTEHRMPSDALPPLWFVEGIAEYLSTEDDSQARMVMRDAVINGYFVGIDDIYAIYGSFLMYKEGQNFLEFVEGKYGPEKVLLFLDNFWMFSSFNKVIEHTIGKTIKEIDEEWSFYLKRKYFPLMESSYPIKNGSEQLTDFGYNFAPVYYEEEGIGFIYFVANRDGYSSVYKMEINKDDEGEFADPDLVLRGEKTEDLESFHLFQSAIDITKNGMLVFVTKSGGTDAIHFFSVKENRIVKTYQNDELINISTPKFSSDGNSIVFHAVDDKGFSDIFALNIYDDELTRITNDYYDDKDPIFGITDDQIIFSSDRTAGEFEKKYNIFSYNFSSKRIKYITNIDADNSAPAISPDKKRLLFLSEYDGVGNIWQIDINNETFSTTAEQKTKYLTSVFNPSFVDTSSILFSGFEQFSFNLYRLNLENNEIVSDSGLTIAMDISPAGKWEANKIAGLSEDQRYDYKEKYTLDYAQSQVTTDPVFGTRGGAVLSLSDLFSNDIFYFLIYNTADVQSDFLKSFNVAIQRINLSERSNYGYGVFHFSGRRYDIRDSDEFFFERSYGGFFLLNFPISKFQRLEASVSIANSDKKVVTGLIERKALLLTNSISWVIDNSIWGPTGPLDGIRARLLLGYTGDVKYSNVNYFTVIADYRQYFRLSLRSAIAFRTALFYNEGKEARRYFMGGSWDLRGWPRWSIRGEKLWFSSFEFRFPLLDQIRLQFPFVNLGFFGIRGAVYFDAGGAWDTDYKNTLGSIGTGLRMNLFGALVLRYDIGKKIENNFNNLQDGLFYQFFFGWDF